MNQEAIGGCWCKNKARMRRAWWCFGACVLRKRWMQRFCNRNIDPVMLLFAEQCFSEEQKETISLPLWQKITGLSENASWKVYCKRSLDQSSATIMVSYGIRPSYLGLYPVRPWKSPRVRKPRLSVQPVPLLDCSHGEKGFPPIQAELKIFQYMTIVFHPPTVHHCEKPTCVFITTFSYVLEGCLYVKCITAGFHLFKH